MKEFIAIISFVLSFTILQFSAFAAELPIEDKNATEISVSFKPGEGVYNVNGKNVKGEVSVQKDGKTFVPVNIIADALGVNLKVDLKAKTALLNYNSVDIKFTEKKKEADVSGKKVSIDAAPYIKNNSFMATITSLADILGADVSTSNGKITFIKEIANPNSIKDFSSLIKKTKKSKVGDSYYNWSMQLPDDLKLEYRNFNGSENIFVSQDESYKIAIFLYDSEGASLDNAVNNIKEEIEGYTLIDFVEDSNNGEDYVEFIYSTDKKTIRSRIYITKTTEYDIYLITENEDDYDDEKYYNLIQSFDFKFKNDGSTEDLSDVTKEGYRKYQDTRLKWSVDMIPYYTEIKTDNIRNVVAFYGNDYEYFSAEVYSLDKGESLDSITKKYLEEDAAHYNSKFYSVTNQEKVKINGLEGNKINYTLKLRSTTLYGCEMFFTDGNYKYIVESEIPESTYNQFSKRRLVEGMINSFSFEKLDPKVTGKLLDPNKVSMYDRVRKINGRGFTMSIPVDWYEDENNTDDYQYFYNYESNFHIGVLDFAESLDRTVVYYDQILESNPNVTVESKETFTDKGTKYVKYVTQSKDKSGTTYKNEIYIIQKGYVAYLLQFSVIEFYYSTKNIDIINKAWQSFTLK